VIPTYIIADMAADNYNFCLPSVLISGETAVDHNGKPDILNTVEDVFHWCKIFGDNPYAQDIFGSEKFLCMVLISERCSFISINILKH